MDAFQFHYDILGLFVFLFIGFIFFFLVVGFVPGYLFLLLFQFLLQLIILFAQAEFIISVLIHEYQHGIIQGTP